MVEANDYIKEKPNSSTDEIQEWDDAQRESADEASRRSS